MQIPIESGVVPELLPLASKVMQAVYAIRQLSIPLIQKLEQHSPGHIYGWRKFSHMEQLVDEIGVIGRSLEFEQKLVLLTQLAARAHDLGRHIEALHDMESLRLGVRHGQLSVEFLEQNKILNVFDSADQRAVIQAVLYHAEREVGLEPGLARRICYLLRDCDKRDIWQGTRYFEVSGALEEIRQHYLNPQQVKLLDSFSDLDLLAKVTEAGLQNKPITLKNLTEQEGSLVLDIHKILTAGVPADLIERFTLGQQLAVQDIRHSWSAYMLYQLAMIYDVENEQILEQAIRHGSIRRIKDYVACRVESADSQRITASFENYLSSRNIR